MIERGEREPVMDDDGYPTEDTLQTIRTWPHDDINGCLDYIARAWWWKDFGVSHELRADELSVVDPSEFREDRYLRLATGGWSGNEDVIAALRDNRFIWYQSWCLSARGGLYIFRYV